MTHAKSPDTSRVSSRPAYLPTHFDLPRQTVPQRRARSLLAVGLLSLSAARAAGAQTTPTYRDARAPTAERVRDLLGRMSVEEKFWQLFMIPGDLDDSSHDYSHGVFGLQIAPLPATPIANEPPGTAARRHAVRINAIQRYFVERTRLGIPIIPFEEALHGFVRDGGTMFPQAIALAATWDTSLVRRVAGAIADETRSRGVRQVLSPVINIATDVRWGRTEETYGEDAYLTSLMGRAFIEPFERAGVVATPKHFVANVGEGGRDSYPIDVSDRELEERFYPPFDVAIHDAGARSVMTAYNSVDGSPATQSRKLLAGKLKGDWGFRGFVISDAAATGGATVLHHTEATTATAARDALEAGLDVIFQSSWPQHRPYLDAFDRGLIAGAVVDSAVARVLRVKLELGLFEHPYVDPDSAAVWNGNAEHRALALNAARASIVLLRNERGTLPLTRRIRSIAVIGEDATEARLGGYSGPGNAKVSILDGVRAKATGVMVRFATGPGRTARDHVVVPREQLSTATTGASTPGLSAEYFDNNRLDGSPRVRRIDPQIDFGWTLNAPAREIPYDWYSVRWTGRVAIPASGVRRIGIEGNDGYRLWLDGVLIVDNWRKRSYGTHMAPVSLRPGSTHDIRIEYFESTGNARVKLVWDAGVRDDWRVEIDSAVAVARRSDVAIVVAGLEEGEFRDRASLGLPGHQDELIRAVAATGRPTIVVLIGGSAITMPWLEHAAAVIDAWYPGEAGGTAVADVLFGDANPAGRIPITFPMAEGQLPLRYDHKPTGRGDDYLDLTGQPLFPFGFGLSYTAFEYADLAIDPATLGTTGAARVSFTVTNTGRVAGDEVAQLYIHDELASVARPVMQLAGFARVHLAPGESTRLTVPLRTDQLRMLDRDLHWVVEPGAFRIMVGASSKDIRLRGALTVQ
jgi:beta-glucosidase